LIQVIIDERHWLYHLISYDLKRKKIGEREWNKPVQFQGKQ